MQPELIHDLCNLSARISAIMNLLRNPESRAKLNIPQADEDLRKALKELEQKWSEALKKIS